MTIKRIGSESGSKPDEIREANIQPVIREYWLAYGVLVVGAALAIALLGNALAALIALAAFFVNSIFVYLAWHSIQHKQAATLQQQLRALLREARQK